MLAVTVTLFVVLLVAFAVFGVAWLGTGVQDTPIPVRVEAWGRKAAAQLNSHEELGQTTVRSW